MNRFRNERDYYFKIKGGVMDPKVYDYVKR